MMPLDMRCDPRNRVLSGLSITESGAFADLLVNKSHPFFFDHPLDHVPGLLMLEGAAQLAHTIGARRSYIRRLSARFIKYALFGSPISLSATVHRDDDITEVNVVVSQDEVERAAVELTLANDPIKLANRVKRNASDPCRPDLLNKARAENVLITDPVLDDDTIKAQLTVRDDNCLLIDTRIAMHPLHLLESFMQTQRYLNNTSENAARIRDILLGVEIEQTAPINAGADVYLIGQREPEKHPRRRLRRGAHAMADGESFASMSITTACLNAA